jgi:CheY-like chemotaxis protein
MSSTLQAKERRAPLRSLWNWLAPPACSVERKAVLARTFRISALVTLAAAIPPGIGIAMLGDHRVFCRHTRVIALTAHAMAGDEQDCINAGMDAYLSKPLDPRMLTDALSRI